MVSSGIQKFRTENWETIWDFSKIGCCLDHHFLSRVSPYLLFTGIFPATEKSIQGIEHSWKSCRIRLLWICKNVSRHTMRIPYVWRGRGNNAGWLGTWNNCPLRTDSTSLKMIFDQLSYRKFFESKFLLSPQFFQLLNTSNTSITKCSFSICQFFVNWSLFSSGLFIPCSSMPNFHCLRINLSLQLTNIIFGKIRSVFMSQDLGFCFCEQLFPCLSKNDPDLTSVDLLVRFALLWHPVDGLLRTC